MTTPLINFTHKSDNQRKYIRSIIEPNNDIIICVGPPGVGKTFLPIGLALQKFYAQEIQQIIFSRPLVCSGQGIGYLPGDLNCKIEPYFQPIAENAIKHLKCKKELNKLLEKKSIVFEPVETMRGRTFDNCYFIIDEAANLEISQVRLAISRIGKNCKTIFTGDLDQSDISWEDNGLKFMIDRLEGDDIVEIVRLEDCDIQRNPKITHILRKLS